MANVAATAVTINDTWTEGGSSGHLFKTVDVTIVLSSQGGNTNQIPASLFGMSRIFWTGPGVNSTSGAYRTTPSFDGSYVGIINSGNNPSDVSDTIRLLISGR